MPATRFDQMVVVYFTAPQRVDFRVLVGELARSLRARIDLRQIGSRDAARLIGGLGNCGRDLCCATFLKDFEPVSLRMAKVQDLPPNPLKISGACGRLMCCLKYEHPLYAEFAREVPAVGEKVALPEGDAVVVAHQVPADSVAGPDERQRQRVQLLPGLGLRRAPGVRGPPGAGRNRRLEPRSDRSTRRRRSEPPAGAMTLGRRPLLIWLLA